MAAVLASISTYYKRSSQLTQRKRTLPQRFQFRVQPPHAFVEVAAFQLVNVVSECRADLCANTVRVRCGFIMVKHLAPP